MIFSFASCTTDLPIDPVVSNENITSTFITFAFDVSLPPISSEVSLIPNPPPEVDDDDDDGCSSLRKLSCWRVALNSAISFSISTEKLGSMMEELISRIKAFDEVEDRLE
jgi:hypothetical protein